MVPLLILVAAYPERSAMATSLAAIGLIAAEGVIFFSRFTATSSRGMRRSSAFRQRSACLQGRPLQQRIETRTLTLAFAGVLDGAIAVRLFVWMDKIAHRRGARPCWRACSRACSALAVGILFVPTLSLALGSRPAARAGDVASARCSPSSPSGPGARPVTATCGMRPALVLGLAGVAGVVAWRLPRRVVARRRAGAPVRGAACSAWRPSSRGALRVAAT